MLTIEKGAYVAIVCDAEGCEAAQGMFAAKPKGYIENLQAAGWRIARHRKGATTAICPECVELQAQVNDERTRMVAESRAKRDAAAADHKALLAKSREGGE